MTGIEVAVRKTKRGAEGTAAQLNERAFVGQRHIVEPGIKPGTFAVVLIDTGAVNEPPPITYRAGRGKPRPMACTSEVGGSRHYKRSTTSARTFG